MEEDSEESISLTEAPSLMANVFNGERTVAYGFKQHCYQVRFHCPTQTAANKYAQLTLQATLTAEVGGQEFKTLVTATDLGNTSGKVSVCCICCICQLKIYDT